MVLIIVIDNIGQNQSLSFMKGRYYDKEAHVYKRKYIKSIDHFHYRLLQKSYNEAK